MGHRVILVWLRAVGIVVEEVLGDGRDNISFNPFVGIGIEEVVGEW